MVRTGLALAALILVLAGCQRADPLARARTDCANDALPASAQANACGALIDGGNLTGADRANARVAQNLFRMATGTGREALGAACFWLKTRARWRERSSRWRNSFMMLKSRSAP